MGDEATAVAARFWSLLQQLGCRAQPTAQTAAGIKVLARRDIADIEAGVEGLPGDWRVATIQGDNGGVAQAAICPLDNERLPEFALARRDGFIMVRMNRADPAGEIGSLVFGVFASTVAALDAIHNDVVARQMGL